MAVTTYDIYAGRGIDAWGHYHLSPVRITGPTTYTTGGDALAAGSVKLGVIEGMLGGLAIATTGAATAVIFAYNRLTGKMQAFWQTGAAAAAALPEVDNGTDLSDYTADVLFYGKP